MDKKNIKKSTLLKLTIPRIKKEKKLFLVTVLFCILSALVSASTPFITKNIIDIIGSTTTPDSEKVLTIIILIIIYFVLVILLFFVRYLFQYFNNLTGMKIEKTLREEAMVKINHLPVDYYSLEPDGKIVAKITSDSNGVRVFYVTMMSIFNALINVSVVYASIIIMEPMLGLIILGLVPFIVVWVTLYRKFSHKFFVRVREISSRITGKLNEDITGALIVQSFTQEDKIIDEYDELVKDHCHNTRITAGINNTFGFELLSLLKRIAEISLLMYLGFTSLDFMGATISLGLIGAIVENLDKMVNPINTIFNNLNELEDSMVGAMRCYDFIAEINDTNIFEGKEAPSVITGDIDFKNVSFSYIENTKVLKDFSYSVKSGQTIGIVGHTGSGKSTLMNLLMCYNDYQEGDILIDGVKLNEYNKASIRRHMGIVLQTPALFEGTIRSNITMGNSYTDDEILNAIRSVGGERLINKDDLMLDSKVSFRGENLSLGEKQLISFARILLRDPKILILDEATANIDSETESTIQHAMNAVIKGRTTFIIAHRLSTIKNVDDIIVLDHGTLVGRGDHNSLYKTCDIYKDMYDSQFKNIQE